MNIKICQTLKRKQSCRKKYFVKFVKFIILYDISEKKNCSLQQIFNITIIFYTCYTFRYFQTFAIIKLFKKKFYYIEFICHIYINSP